MNRTIAQHLEGDLDPEFLAGMLCKRAGMSPAQLTAAFGVGAALYRLNAEELRLEQVERGEFQMSLAIAEQCVSDAAEAYDAAVATFVKLCSDLRLEVIDAPR